MILQEGQRVQITVVAYDDDEQGHSRRTDPGTLGTVTTIDRRASVAITHVTFDNGAFLPFTEAERDRCLEMV